MAEDEPTNASALIHDGDGRYLLHLRDHLPGEIWAPGQWELLGGGREPEDASLEETVRRELREEAGLDLPVLAPFAARTTTDLDGRPLRSQVFVGRWNGDPSVLPLTEGVMLHWWRPEDLRVLHVSTPLRELVHRHAREPRPQGEAVPPRPGTAHRNTAGAAMWETVARLARHFDAHDRERGLDRRQQWTLQALKLAEETGEVAQAVIGACGTNPRKGASHGWQDVHAEIADVALTGLVALARMRGGGTEEYLHRQLAEKAATFLSPHDGGAPSDTDGAGTVRDARDTTPETP